MIPWAPALFNLGIISRTVFSSTTVSTASHLLSLKGEMVGEFKAGRRERTLFNPSFLTFIFSPTFPSAAKAPKRRTFKFSILDLFQEFFQEEGLAMSFVFDSITRSIIRKLFACRDSPVSVSSTIASASSGGFTSVAPQENSTLAFTLYFFK